MAILYKDDEEEKKRRRQEAILALNNLNKNFGIDEFDNNDNVSTTTSDISEEARKKRREEAMSALDSLSENLGITKTSNEETQKEERVINSIDDLTENEKQYYNNATRQGRQDYINSLTAQTEKENQKKEQGRQNYINRVEQTEEDNKKAREQAKKVAADIKQEPTLQVGNNSSNALNNANTTNMSIANNNKTIKNIDTSKMTAVKMPNDNNPVRYLFNELKTGLIGFFDNIKQLYLTDMQVQNQKAVERSEKWGLSKLAGARSNSETQALADKANQALKNLSNSGISKTYQDMQKNGQLQRENKPEVLQTLGMAAENVGNQIPSVAVSIVSPSAGLFLMGASAAGGAMKQTQDEGFSPEKAQLYGEITGGIEIVTEKITGGVPFFGKGTLDNIVELRINKKIKSSVGQFIAKEMYDFSGEILEEHISNFAGYATDKVILNKELPNLESIIKDADETTKVTFYSTLMLKAMGLPISSNNTKSISKDFRQSENIELSKENIAKLNEAFEIVDKAFRKNYYLPSYSNGTISNFSKVTGQEFELSNKKLNINPVVIENNGHYEIIDKATGLVLDNSFSLTENEAIAEFNNKIKNIDSITVKEINNQIIDANRILQNKVLDLEQDILNFKGNQTEAKNVDIIKNKIYNKITNVEKSQVVSEVMSWKGDSPDGIGFIDLSRNGYASYSYIKNGTDVQVLQKFIGNEEFINKAREVVLDGIYTESQGLNKYFEDVKSRLKNNISNNSSITGGQQSTNYIGENSTNVRQQRGNNISEDNARNNKFINDNVENSNESSFSIDQNINTSQNVQETNSDNLASNIANNISQKINSNTSQNDSNFYNPATKYVVNGAEEFINRFNDKKTYTEEQISNIVDEEYDNIVNYDNQGDIKSYIDFETEGNTLQISLKDGNTDEIIKATGIEANKNGRYSAEEIKNAIRDITIENENRPIKGQQDIEGNEVRSMKEEKNVSNINSIKLKKAIDAFKKVKGTANKNDILNIARNMNIYHKGKTYVDNQMLQKSINNPNPKITIIDEYFKNYNDKEDLRKQAYTYAINNLTNKKVLIKDIQKNIDMAQKGLKKTFGKNQDNMKMQTANNLLYIIGESTYLNSSINTNNKNMIYHYFISPVSINNNNELVMITISEDITNKNENNKFYYHDIRRIEDINNNNKENKAHAMPHNNVSNMLFEQYSPSVNTSITQNSNNVNKSSINTKSMQNNKVNTIYRKFTKEFKNKGYIDLNDKTVNNIEEVADIAQIFRNPNYETFRIIYVKENAIVGQEAISSKIPGFSTTLHSLNKAKNFYNMKDRIARLHADGYYLIHNHPSGKAKASSVDISATANFIKNVDGFKGHIIVNSGTYATLTLNENNEIVDKNYIKLNNYSENEIESLIGDNPLNNIKINSTSELAKLAHNIKNSPNYSMLVLTDATLKIRTILDIPNKYFNNKEINNYIKNVAKTTRF